MTERYKLLSRAASLRCQDREQSSAEYAGFLLEHERKCATDGFLDSKKYRNPYIVKGGLGINLPPKKGSCLPRPHDRLEANPPVRGKYNSNEHLQQIQFAEKNASRAAEIEYNLFIRMRSAEFKSKKIKSRTNDLQTHLDRLRKENSDQLKRSWALAKKREEELTQQLRKEMSELQKHQHRKEFIYQTLINHRALQKEDQHILEEMQKEYRR
nr:PREDICTED: uncharacterized protein LOC107077313 isoform X1 [Lepisosteus oculatus]